MNYRFPAGSRYLCFGAVALGCVALAACMPEEKTTPPKLQTVAETAPTAPAPAQVKEYESAAGNYLAGRYARNARDFNSAAEFLSDVLSRDNENPKLRRQVFFSLAASGKVDEALALASGIAETDKRASVPALLLILSDLKAGQFDIAVEKLVGLGKIGMNSFTGPMLLAWGRVAQGKHAAGIEALKPLEKISAFNGLRFMHTGFIHDLAGNAEAAEAAYKDALKAGKTLRAVQALGNFLERAGRGEEARAVYDDFIKTNQNSVHELSDVWPRLEKSLKPPRLINDASAGVTEVMFDLSGTLGRSSSVDLALVYGRFTLWLRENFPLAQVLVGDLLEILDRREEALAVFASIDRASPQSWTAGLRQAAILSALEKHDEAAKILEAMSAEHKDRPEALIQLGDMYRGQKKFLEGADAYSAALARAGEPKETDWALFYSRGITYERSKQWDKAEADFLKALELSPDQPFVLNYLGYSWVDQGQKLDRARKMIEEAVRRRPNDGYIVDSLGWVLYRLGDYKGATIHLERAVTLRPEDPTINDHLGDAYWRVGRVLEARFQWRRALSLEPEKDQIPLIEKKLQQGLADASEKDNKG